MIEMRAELDALANYSIEKEVLFKDDLEKLIGKRPFDKPELENDTPNVDGGFTVSINTDVQ